MHDDPVMVFVNLFITYIPGHPCRELIVLHNYNKQTNVAGLKTSYRTHAGTRRLTGLDKNANIAGDLLCL
jgi:hypothetical protein